MSNVIYYGNELYHHGVKGMKWGQRRYQNEDGSLKAAGERHRMSLSDRLTNRVDNKYSKSIAKNQKRVDVNRTMASMQRNAQENAKTKIGKAAYGINAKYYEKRAEKLDRRTTRLYGEKEISRREVSNIGKTAVKSLLLRPMAVRTYDSFRAKGEGRVKAYLKTSLSAFVGGNIGMAIASNRAAYDIGVKERKKAEGQK